MYSKKHFVYRVIFLNVAISIVVEPYGTVELLTRCGARWLRLNHSFGH